MPLFKSQLLFTTLGQRLKKLGYFSFQHLAKLALPRCIQNLIFGNGQSRCFQPKGPTVISQPLLFLQKHFCSSKRLTHFKKHLAINLNIRQASKKIKTLLQICAVEKEIDVSPQYIALLLSTERDKKQLRPFPFRNVKIFCRDIQKLFFFPMQSSVDGSAAEVVVVVVEGVQGLTVALDLAFYGLYIIKLVVKTLGPRDLNQSNRGSVVVVSLLFSLQLLQSQ